MTANGIDDVVEQQLGDRVVGVAIAVVAGDEVAWSRGFGRLDVTRPEPVTTHTEFSIQSVSKSIVATALMHFVERGAIGLDDPVNAHLAPVALTNEWEAHSPVTIRQLLTHTAGLPLSVGWGSSASLEAVVAQDVRTEAEPGTRLLYANWGYDVLGYLVSRLAGMPWDEAVADIVLRPLGMTATLAAGPGAGSNPGEQATGYVISEVDGAHLPLGPPAWPYLPGPPSGSLVSHADDLARFLSAHLTGGASVLAAETVADMHRLHAPLGCGGGGMGLGFRVDRRAGRPFFCHVGDGSGFTTFVGGHPDERVGVVVLMNAGGADEARSKIARAALDWALQGAPPRVVAAVAASRPVDGNYRSTYWGLGAAVAERDGVPVVTLGSSVIASSESVSRLTERGGRWQADGGMFDGCELDFEASLAEPRFYGGLYPFEFVFDDSPPPTLPTTVDEHGEIGGSWAGTLDTPIGEIPFELRADAPNRTVRIDVMGSASVDDDAEIAGGWIRARLELEVIGFGYIVLFTRLGLVEERLEGLIYARNDSGEITMATSLGRPSPDPDSQHLT